MHLDFANALNLVSRSAFLLFVRERFPELYCWVNYN